MPDIKDYDKAFRKAYLFMQKHLSTATDEDWQNLSNGIAQFKGQFEIDLMVAVTSEIERIYKERNDGL